MSDRYPHELFFPDKRYDWEKNNRKKLLAEGNARLTSPIYNIAFMALALNAVLGGGFQPAGLRPADRDRGGDGRRHPHPGVRRPGGLRRDARAQHAAVADPAGARGLDRAAAVRPGGLRSIGLRGRPGRDAPAAAAGVTGAVPGLGRIQRYVLVRALWGVAMALAVIAAIILLVDFVAISRDVGVRAKDSSVGQLIGLTLLQSPSVILILFPFAFLFGVLGAFANMNRRSELTAMRAAGVSAWRFTLPAAAAAALVGAFSITALNPVTAAMNDRYERDKAVLMSGYLNVAPKTVWLRQGSKSQQVIIRAAAREGPRRGAAARRVAVRLLQSSRAARWCSAAATTRRRRGCSAGTGC